MWSWRLTDNFDITNKTIPWRTIFCQKLISLSKTPEFYATRLFLIEYTISCHWPPFCARWIQYITFHHISLRQGSTNFPKKIWQRPQNSKGRKGGTKLLPCWGPGSITRHPIKFSCPGYPSKQDLCTPVLRSVLIVSFHLYITQVTSIILICITKYFYSLVFFPICFTYRAQLILLDLIILIISGEKLLQQSSLLRILRPPVIGYYFLRLSI
jgi:hypothetical protein